MSIMCVYEYEYHVYHISCVYVYHVYVYHHHV